MELSCPAPKHGEYGRKMASAAWEAHETPRLSAKFSSYDPFKTARLNQAGRKNKLRHSCGVTATLATKNHKALKVANSGGPVPVGPVPLARSRGPGGRSRWPGPVARSRWPDPGGPVPGGPVPVARSRWPGPGGPVPVARSRSRFKGACPRARAKKDLFCLSRSLCWHCWILTVRWNLRGGAITALLAGSLCRRCCVLTMRWDVCAQPSPVFWSCPGTEPSPTFWPGASGEGSGPVPPSPSPPMTGSLTHNGRSLVLGASVSLSTISMADTPFCKNWFA